MARRNGLGGNSPIRESKAEQDPCGCNGDTLYGVPKIRVTMIFSQGLGSMPVLKELLHEREQYHLHMLEALPVAIYTTDASGKITYYNQAAADLAGRHPSLAATNGVSPGGCIIPTARPCRTTTARWP